MSKRITLYSGEIKEISTSDLEKKLISAGKKSGLPGESIKAVAEETFSTLYENMPEQEVDRALMQSAAQHIKDDPAYDKLAAGLLLELIYLEALGVSSSDANFLEIYKSAWGKELKAGIEKGWLSPKLEIFDWNNLSELIKPERDDLFTYAGLETLSRRYMMRDDKQKLMETPQYFWLRLAMGLAWNEKNLNEVAGEFYDRMSQLYYIPGGSTNVNAGALKPRLSNCFIMEMEDNVDHIGKTVSDVLKLSKATGGIGLAVTKLRASGSPISTNNTFSSGPIPFLHIIDSAIRAISRAGKKMGALCFYMENWHFDFQEYLDLKQNAGDDYRRTRTANTAVYISDEFMKRVKADDYWYLFDPKDTADLVDLYGEAFSSRYQEYCAMAESGELKAYKKIKALDQFRQIIVSLQAAAHPWITFKDAINVRALNNNTGTIYGSNLCTEITLPTNKDNVAVCNLASINLVRHLKEGADDSGVSTRIEINWEELNKSVRLAVRQLDNLVDINEPPIEEARNFDTHNRAIGLGVMGLADLFERFDIAYDSVAAYELTDKVMEFISYQAIDESTNLAKERGTYDNFPGSLWSKGLVPLDTIKILEDNRTAGANNDGVALINKSFSLDWNNLRAKVKIGMRNSTLMAIAPTANIGLVAGTSTGIDPRFAQIFSRNTLGGKHMELNINLVTKLKELGLWEKAKDDILASYGDISDLDYIPAEIKLVYKDSFSVDPQAFVEVASRAQKWVDQAISRNMYLESRDIDNVMKVYVDAWERGLKTTYYLHMKPRHSAEQSTLAINKSTAIGKAGFGAVSRSGFGAVAVSVKVEATAPMQNEETEAKNDYKACPIDPQERAQCDSCQ
ncbi:MAG: ribonucleoside-diphosphate reductase subunit alpha [Patescibacteria group bacterium]